MTSPASTVYLVPGVSCDHCKHAIETEVGAVGGVAAVAVDLDAKTVRVEGNAGKAEVRAATERAGYAITEDPT